MSSNSGPSPSQPSPAPAPSPTDLADALSDGLAYYDRSRRQFLKLTGLTLAGLLRSPPWMSRATASPAEVAQASVPVPEAIARALQDAGVEVVTHVPATGAAVIFDACQRLAGRQPHYSFNEEVAFTIAHGAALAGSRSVSILKAHGLAKAANSVIDAVTLGTTAGLVILVADDPTGKHSDNIFGLEEFLKGTGIPFKKAGPATVYRDVHESLLWSEELRTPVALILDAELPSRATVCSRQPLPPATARYQRDPLRHLLCPPLAAYQHLVQQARLARRDTSSIPVPPLPDIPAGLPPAWRGEVERLLPLFRVFLEFRSQIPFVAGDTGLSTLFGFPPFRCIDACSYYGGSLPLALGFHLSGAQPTWAVTGDYAFVAAGHLGLVEALARKAPLKVLVVDNGAAMATGGQPLPSAVLDQLLSGWAPYVTRLDHPQGSGAARDVLARAVASPRLEIVVAQFRTAPRA